MSAAKKSAQKNKRAKGASTKHSDAPTQQTTQSLTGVTQLTKETYRLLVRHRGVFGRLTLVATLFLMLFSGNTQQGHYAGIADSIQELGKPVGMFVLYTSALGGTLSSAFTESQQLYVGIIYLMTWLITIWLLRRLIMGDAVQLRDGVYSAGSPVLSTVLIVIVGLIQLLPIALGVALLVTLMNAGILSNIAALVVMSMLVLFLGGLSLYWLVGTLVAGIIVTVPGTYPMAALRSAKQLLVGLRKAVLLRLLWLGGLVVLVFAILLLPIIGLDVTFGYVFSWIVVFLVQLLTVMLVVYGSTYLYLLYRRIIDVRS